MTLKREPENSLRHNLKTDPETCGAVFLQLTSLKERVAEELTRVTVDRLKLILGGKVLTDGSLNLDDGGEIEAM